MRGHKDFDARLKPTPDMLPTQIQLSLSGRATRLSSHASQPMQIDLSLNMPMIGFSQNSAKHGNTDCEGPRSRPQTSDVLSPYDSLYFRERGNRDVVTEIGGARVRVPGQVYLGVRLESLPSNTNESLATSTRSTRRHVKKILVSAVRYAVDRLYATVIRKMGIISAQSMIILDHHVSIMAIAPLTPCVAKKARSRCREAERPCLSCFPKRAADPRHH